MPSVRSLVFKRRAYIVTIILSLGEIMPTYSHYIRKGLVYIIITALFNRQPSSYLEFTKLNIHLSCNICLMSNTKYIYLITHP
jgi:hypothetical protein